MSNKLEASQLQVCGLLMGQPCSRPGQPVLPGMQDPSPIFIFVKSAKLIAELSIFLIQT